MIQDPTSEKVRVELKVGEVCAVAQGAGDASREVVLPEEEMLKRTGELGRDGACECILR